MSDTLKRYRVTWAIEVAAPNGMAAAADALAIMRDHNDPATPSQHVPIQGSAFVIFDLATGITTHTDPHKILFGDMFK